MTHSELESKIKSFNWYHEIEVPPFVTGPKHRFKAAWDLIDQGIAALDLKDTRVLDIGARDAKYSFLAEKMGASKVVAFDNDPSPGALWLIEHFQSKVQYKTANLYNLKPTFGKFDVIFFFGVLYHLRYPMRALRIISQLMEMGGKLYIESGMLDQYNDTPLLYCPVRTSPYEITSCTFFNGAALAETLWSFGITQLSHRVHPMEQGQKVRRIWIEAEKTHEMPADLQKYWEGTHKSHD